MAKKYDYTSAIINYEEGNLDKAGTIKLFQYLVDTGMAWRLQGFYGRTAQAMIDEGIIKYPRKHKGQSSTDYYGNPIPTHKQYTKWKKSKEVK